MAKVMSMGPGDVIIEEGDLCDDIFLLQKGKLKIYVKDSETKKNKKIGYIHEGEIFGEMAMFLGKKRSATVIAETHSEIVKVSKESFKEAIDKLPDWLKTFIETLIVRVSKQNKEVK